MRGGAGDGAAAKENAAMPGWARSTRRFRVGEAMDAIFPGPHGNSKVLKFRRDDFDP